MAKKEKEQVTIEFSDTNKLARLTKMKMVLFGVLLSNIFFLMHKNAKAHSRWMQTRNRKLPKWIPAHQQGLITLYFRIESLGWQSISNSLAQNLTRKNLDSDQEYLS